MEVTALCIHIFMTVFVLLSKQACLSYTVQKPGSMIISPDRLQFFEYECVSVNCVEDEDMNAWRVMRKLSKMSPANLSEGCSNPAPSCTIHHTFKRHSGEYWCENDEGERSQAVNISVTAGRVILNISTQPVKEGSNVTLRCINKNTKKAYNSDFYKDGFHQGTYYETDMTLSKVSKSDEGLYKCSISAAGEFPESWLAVVKPLEEEDSPPISAPYVVSCFSLFRRLVVISLYCITAGLLISIYCCRKTGKTVGATEMAENDEIPPKAAVVSTELNSGEFMGDVMNMNV